jgi:menaquinone-9 beta-reductase
VEPKTPSPTVKQFDIIVVGSGPAGSIAALILARAGKRVALLDKARFPRPKVCGDCINPGCWPIWERNGLAEKFAALPHHPIAGISLELNRKTIFTKNFVPGERGERAIERALLDDWLCLEAEAAGAELFLTTRVDGLGKDGLIKTTGGNLKAHYILGADGRNSTIARLAGLADCRQTCTRVAWQASIETEDLPSLDNRIHLHVFDEGYYGLTRTSPTTANLCLVLGSQATSTPQKITNRYFPKLPALVWRSVFPISRKRATLGHGRIWLAGDAARVVEPFSGEGIYFALASGEAAARAILEGFQTKNDASALAKYSAVHSALYEHRSRVNTLTQWCAKRPKRAVHMLGLLQYWPNGIDRMLSHVQKQRAASPDPKSAAVAAA